MNVALDSTSGARTGTQPSTILFLAANPVRIPLLQIGEECRAIEDKIRGARFRDQLSFRSRWAARPDDLLQALHEDDPTVLHFSGHGAGAQGLCFLAEDGDVFCVSSDGLGQVIRAAGDSIKLIVLNACYTKVQAEALVAHVPCVIGMPDTIGDKAAIVYAADLYRALAFGKSVASAHQCGLAALALRSTSGQTRDIDLAETALRTKIPEILTRTDIDAKYVYIVQKVDNHQPLSISLNGTRIHLEIDIDTEFETVDADALGRIVMEVCRLSGGQSVRIVCVTKGSLRVTISFAPEAARTILKLRDNGQLTEICGLRVTNVIELGPVEIATQQSSSPRPAESVSDAHFPSSKPQALSLGALGTVHHVATRTRPLFAQALQLSEPPHTLEDLEPFAEVRPALLRTAERMCGNRADAEDLLQEVFLRAVERGIPAEVRNIPAWLTTSLHNLFIDRCRSMTRRPGHEFINDSHHDSLTQFEPAAPEPLWSDITVADIREACDAIKPVYGEVYRLATFQNQSYAEIAQRLGITRSTVCIRLHRARKMLREILVARFGLEEEEP